MVRRKLYLRNLRKRLTFKSLLTFKPFQLLYHCYLQKKVWL